MTENEKLRALLAEIRTTLLGSAWMHQGHGDFPASKCGLCQPVFAMRVRIHAALAEPVVEEPVAIRSGSPMYACLDCGHCDEALTLSWQDGEPTRAMCVKCRQNRVDHIEGAVLALVRERDEARAMLSAICSELEGAVAHADRRAAGSPGMSVPFTGDFASATQLPSVVSRMRWWAREMRRVIGEEKP